MQDDDNASSASTQSASTAPRPTHSVEEVKTWYCVWASYFDLEKSHAQGRRVGKTKNQKKKKKKKKVEFLFVAVCCQRMFIFIYLFVCVYMTQYMNFFMFFFFFFTPNLTFYHFKGKDKAVQQPSAEEIAIALNDLKLIFVAEVFSFKFLFDFDFFNFLVFFCLDWFSFLCCSKNNTHAISSIQYDFAFN